MTTTAPATTIKFSQITLSTANFTTGDYLVGVQSGQNDILFSKSQLLGGVSFTTSGLFVGGLVNTVYDYIPETEFNGDSYAVSIQSWSNSATHSPNIYLTHARGNNVTGNYGASVSGDWLGFVGFSGADGTNFEESAWIIAEVDDTVSSNSVPACLRFGTTQAGSQFADDRMRITSGGAIRIGNYTSDLSIESFPSSFQFVGDGNSWSASYAVFSDSTSGAQWAAAKSRNATFGSHTVVQSGDFLWNFEISGDDGTQFVPAVQIYAQVDGTPGTNDMPGRLIFAVTADGSAAPTERIRLDSQGLLTYSPGTTTPVTLGSNGQYTLTPTSNTNFRISFRGTDGVTRIGNITLA